MSLFDFSGRQISGFAPGSHFGAGQARGFPTKPGPGRPSQMAPQFTLQPPMQFGQYPSKPGPGRPSQMSPPSQQKPRTGSQAPFARYAAGTDMSQVQRTDTMQPNPLYRPRHSPYDTLLAPRPADGNLAYAPPDERPQPFTQSMNFMGRPVDPGQFYGQRDAFIQNINQAKQPFAMNPAAGRPKMDFGGMWNQAGDMVQGGWQNPLAGMLR